MGEPVTRESDPRDKRARHGYHGSEVRPKNASRRHGEERRKVFWRGAEGRRKAMWISVAVYTLRMPEIVHSSGHFVVVKRRGQRSYPPITSLSDGVKIYTFTWVNVLFSRGSRR